MNKQRLAISTVSLGWHSSHTLERKLAAAAYWGFEALEIFHDDLTKFASAHGISHLQAARKIRIECDRHHLAIVCLCSLDNFEGSLEPLANRLATAETWIELAHALGTNVIQIPSSYDPKASGDEDLIVSELRQLAALGAAAVPPILFAYEALVFGTHVADWEESLRVVELVGRQNFGLCLDTYHVLTRLWADPRSESGLRPGGHAALRASIQRFLDGCPAEKIIYVQLSDAERQRPPILPGHPAYDAAKDGTHSWCSYGRLFPLEKENGAYLPMLDISRALLQTKGWSGFVSLEIFHRDMNDEAAGPEHWAARGKTSWDKLKEQLEPRTAALF